MYRKISTPIAISIILILAITVGIIDYWQYIKIRDFDLEMTELKIPENKEEELCFKGELEGLIVKEITDNSLRKLIIRVLIEEAKNYGVLKEEKICAAQRYLISGEKIQLNEDEIPEYIIFPEGFYTDNKFTNVRGASGNGPLYIIGFIQGKWRLIGNFGGSWVRPIKSRRTKGYLNLVTHWHMSVEEGRISEYAWDGEMYKLIKTTEYSPEIPLPDEYQQLYE